MPTKLEVLLLEHRVVHGPRCHHGESYLWCLLESIVSHPDAICYGSYVAVDGTMKAVLELHPFPDVFYEAGFLIRDNFYIIREDVTLEHLTSARDAVAGIFNNETYDYPDNLIRRVHLPPFYSNYTQPFLRDLQHRSHIAMGKDDPELQNAAMEIIRRGDVELNAKKHFNAMQKMIMEGSWSGEPLSYRSFLLDSLVNWFKESCFRWVDNPPCDHCSSKTVMSHMSQDHLLLKFAERVEMHRCVTCHTYTPFPRYNNPYMLLLTRKGRCGEFANAFTLFCRALGWDARHAYDETDHVWTEVYSEEERRWLHVDPCEAKIDAPLMYEHGWNKKLSYVIAYSGTDVQDVTWRYTSDFEATRKRRDRCDERDLVAAIVETRALRQRGLTDAQRTALALRTANELCEMMTERKPSEGDMEGRISGSLEWRRMRNEIDSISGKDSEAFTWPLEAGDSFSLSYSAALDKYECASAAGLKELHGFKAGTFYNHRVFRKVELDWKMAYLCRAGNEKPGEIVWAFEVTKAGMVLDHVEAQLKHKTFENGQVDVTIYSGTNVIAFGNETKIVTATFSGLKKFFIRAVLKGGVGASAWQHAQLFRQPLDSGEYTFAVKVKLKRSERN